ncbi:MAG: class I tRNA ligase family protein, partial [Acidimicrobiales bacterium]|nr:class I tRNA ligase family protein [Acidimicrobiales bacterium]
ASGRPGTDTAFDPGQMKIGRRLAIKILNASKFALGTGEPSQDAQITDFLDLAMLVELAALVDDATRAFDGFDYARALQRTEEFFWRFCDDYLELVKARAYGEGSGADSARLALRTALDTMLALFAPFLPYVTEEVWSWYQQGSLHRSAWPQSASLRSLAADMTSADGVPSCLAVTAEVLGKVRKAKSDAKVSQRAVVETLKVTDTADRISALNAAVHDLNAAGSVTSLQLVVAEPGVEPSVEVILAPQQDE